MSIFILSNADNYQTVNNVERCFTFLNTYNNQAVIYAECTFLLFYITKCM